MTKKRNRDNDVTVRVKTVKPVYTFKVTKSYGEPYEEVIHRNDTTDIHKLMAEGISQYSSDTESLRLPWHETWELLEDGKVIMSFSRADLEDRDRFWTFVKVIRTHSCLIFELRNDY